MAVISRPKQQRRLAPLLFPVMYLSIGAVFGFAVAVTWLPSQPLSSVNLVTSVQTTAQPLLEQQVQQQPQQGLEDQPQELQEQQGREDERPPQEQPQQEQQQNFFAIANRTGTDKVAGLGNLEACLKDDTQCTRPSCIVPKCRPWGHFYQTMYQSRLGHLSYNSTTTPEFQMLEIGFYHGRGYEAFSQFFPRSEFHSMEISCLPKGPVSENKWPHGNFAARNRKWYSRLRHEKKLHCGDASNVDWLHQIWTTHMLRPDAPPLKLVIDDGSHLARHMVATVFFWFPRIEPGGHLVIEDIQPTKESNKFRTQFLPQIISDLHFCGDPKEKKDEPCFPLLQRLLHSVHCEMHICILERNQEPAMQNLSLVESKPSRSALSLGGCRALKDSFGIGL